jgi:hypothetical protein
VPTSVSDLRSNENDQIDFAVRSIGKGRHRRLVFEAVYFGKSPIKTVSKLCAITHLPRKRVLEEAIKLAHKDLIVQTKIAGELAYKKEAAIAGCKQRIIQYIKSPKKLATLPTKTRPRVSGSVGKLVTVSIPRKLAQTKPVSVDDIDQFKRVKQVKIASARFTPIPEARFKAGFKKLIGEPGKFSDWGGEKNDLFSTKLLIKGARKLSAIAFKGPGTKGVLTPKKMGKHGDQIQRLFQSSADVFFVQYWAQIDQSVTEQMDAFARIRAASSGRMTYFGIIDGSDSTRLIKAYPTQFKSNWKPSTNTQNDASKGKYHGQAALAIRR